MLDGVREVFDRVDAEDALGNQEFDENDARVILESIPSPKKVFAGKAVFIIPETIVKVNEEEKAAQRNAKVTKESTLQ